MSPHESLARPTAGFPHFGRNAQGKRTAPISTASTDAMTSPGSLSGRIAAGSATNEEADMKQLWHKAKALFGFGSEPDTQAVAATSAEADAQNLMWREHYEKLVEAPNDSLNRLAVMAQPVAPTPTPTPTPDARLRLAQEIAIVEHDIAMTVRAIQDTYRHRTDWSTRD